MISFDQTDNGKKTIVCFLLFFFFLQMPLSVKGYNLRKINDSENLSGSSIFSFHQDREGVMWIGTNRGVDRYDGKRITKYSPENDDSFFSGSIIDRIEQTSDSLCWIQTFHGLYKVNTETSSIESFDMFDRIAFFDKDSRGNVILIQGNNSLYYKSNCTIRFEQVFVPDLRANDVVDFFVDSADRLWIIRSNGNNLCFSIEVNSFGDIRFDPLPGYTHPSKIYYCANNDKELFYFVDEAYSIHEYDTSTGEIHFVCNIKERLAGKDEITSLLKFHEDYFIGFRTSGLSLLRKIDSEYELESLDVLGGIGCLLKDTRQDMVWIGTLGHGVYTYSMDRYSIRSVRLNDLTLKVRQPVSALFLDQDHSLWIGSKGDGIIRVRDFHPERSIEGHRVELIFATSNGLRDNMILSFGKSRYGGFWIGSERGLSYFKRKENRIITIPLLYNGDSIGYVSDLYEQDSLLWISTMGQGAIRARLEWKGDMPALSNVKQFAVKKEDEFSNNFQGIYPETDSLLWFMNKGDGIFRLTGDSTTWNNVRFKGNTVNEINTILKDYWGDYLIGTNFGLVKYTSTDYRILNETTGFPTNVVNGILSDTYSGYWLSTNRGLVLYNVANESFRVYDHRDGLTVLEFCEGSSFKDETNRVAYFGGTNGFVSIQKNYFDEGQHYMPPIYFKTITIRDKPYSINDFLFRSGENAFLRLTHEQNSFTLSFAVIDHLNGNSYTYYYRLGDTDSLWINNGNSDALSFADLRPGRYSLYVKYYNKVLGKESYIYKVNIRVIPPWYASPLAYIIYFLSAVALILFAARLLILFNRKRKADRTQRMEQKHREEIYESKLRFFTNISHEFCTPLTLISAPCNRLVEQKNIPDSAKKYITLIQQNAERLNSLIQDLIEFNRIESGYKKPIITSVHIDVLANKLIGSFTDMAESQNVVFEKDISPALTWNTDSDFVVTILLNLLSNAFKYTDGTKIVRVKVTKENEDLTVIVSNTGKGIDAKDIPTLFDRYRVLQRFERNDHTSFWSRNGLGLAISYNLVRLLNGTIEVESTLNEWTHFKVRLPYLDASSSELETLRSEISPNRRLSYNAPLQIPQIDFDDLKLTLLVVDDDAEIRWIIFDLFREEYNVLTAENPVEALELLKEIHPDLIISDVIMPQIDGLTFSRQVKTDESTAHIPLILLSARRDIEGQTEGLDAGAEIYITKPFDVAYLKSSVQRLLERKESLREYFASPLSSYALEKGRFAHKEHKKFIREILKIINKNINNKELSANWIADKMNIGLRSFYRKVEESEDLSIVELINNSRLLKAVDLLIKTKLTIDEIVSRSGFTNRSTFYRTFSNRYGCTPSEYRKQHELKI